MRAHTTLLLALALVALVSLVGTARADIRRDGMAGAGAALATGSEAAHANPALLGGRAGQGWSARLLGVGAGVGNNAIGRQLYERANGATLDEADKQALLSAIPRGGLVGHGRVDLGAFALRRGGLAVGASGLAEATTNVPRDIFELLLYGNAHADSLLFDGARGEAIALASAGISAGVPVAQLPMGRVSVGMTVRLLRSFGYARLLESGGSLHTGDIGSHGEAQLALLHARGGDGYGLDLGAALESPGGWRLSLAVSNVAAALELREGATRREYTVSTDTLSVESLADGDGGELYRSTESSVALGGLAVSLPRVAHVSLGRQGQRLRWAADLELRTGSTPLAQLPPRVALGAEWSATGWLPLRVGLSGGGALGRSAAAGLGLRLGWMRLDLSASAEGAWWPGDAHGLGVGLGLGLGG